MVFKIINQLNQDLPNGTNVASWLANDYPVSTSIVDHIQSTLNNWVITFAKRPVNCIACVNIIQTHLVVARVDQLTIIHF